MALKTKIPQSDHINSPIKSTKSNLPVVIRVRAIRQHFNAQFFHVRVIQIPISNNNNNNSYEKQTNPSVRNHNPWNWINPIYLSPGISIIKFKSGNEPPEATQSKFIWEPNLSLFGSAAIFSNFLSNQPIAVQKQNPTLQMTTKKTDIEYWSVSSISNLLEILHNASYAITE